MFSDKKDKMTRTKLLSILQEETDGFNEQSRLRDDVLDAMEEAYLKGKREQLNIPVVVGQSELLLAYLKYQNSTDYKPETIIDKEVEKFLSQQ